MLAVIRRRLAIATWSIVSTQSLVLALGTAQVCAQGEHTHAGRAAPECAMHHHGGGTNATGDAHHHDAAESFAASGAAAQLSCRCSTEVPSTFLGYHGLIERPFVTLPALHAVPLTPAVVAPYSDRTVLPASPPPRSA